jgi:hypothetical protein
MGSWPDEWGARHMTIRSMLFRCGDCFFLILTAAVATWTMWLFHGFGWPMPVTWIAGMAAAMAAQMILALAVAPLLGSIESMVPSMVVGMIAPMAVCASEFLGLPWGWRASVIWGAVCGASMFIFVIRFGRSCRRALRDGAVTE